MASEKPPSSSDDSERLRISRHNAKVRAARWRVNHPKEAKKLQQRYQDRRRLRHKNSRVLSRAEYGAVYAALESIWTEPFEGDLLVYYRPTWQEIAPQVKPSE